MITKKEFEEYERIRTSGVTNMFDVNTVVLLSDFLTIEKCIKIIKNYSELKQKFVEEKLKRTGGELK